jgi:hypothetical protein
MSRITWRGIPSGLAWLACITWLLPVTGGQAAPLDAARPATPVRDIALDAQGRITGQYVDAQGQPRAHQVLVVQRQGGAPRQATTDARGRFILESMSGGMYQIASADSAVVCRCWAVDTAPPAATRELLLVSGEGVQRAQRPIGDLLFSGPVLIALVIAAAIAIPIAIHNSDDAS